MTLLVAFVALFLAVRGTLPLLGLFAILVIIAEHAK